MRRDHAGTSLPCVYTRLSRLWRHKSSTISRRSMRRRCKHIFQVCLRQCAKGSLQIQSLSATNCYLTSVTNSLVLAEITRLRTGTCCALYTQRRPFAKYLLSYFLADFWYTRWSHAHNFCDDGLQLTDTTETAADSTFTKKIVHSVFCVNGLSRLPGVLGYTCCRTGVWSKFRVTARSTGDGEVDKITHQPTHNSTNKNTPSKFDPYLWTCDVSVPPMSSRLSSSSSTQVLL